MKKMGISNEQFKKMVVSNMMYDLNLNGFDFTPENIKTVIGKGFIPNAIAYNKRAQIWMTNGYGGNKEYIKSQIKDLSAAFKNWATIFYRDEKKMSFIDESILKEMVEDSSISFAEMINNVVNLILDIDKKSK